MMMIRPLLLSSIAFLVAAPAIAAEPVTMTHNRSVMSAVPARDGTFRIVYSQPREGLDRAGVSRNTVLFEGRMEGTHIEGEARAFKYGCSPAKYWVFGNVEDGVVSLRGEGPVRNGCAFTLSADSPHSSLVFEGDHEAILTLDPNHGFTPQPPLAFSEEELRPSSIETAETVEETVTRDETRPETVTVTEEPPVADLEPEIAIVETAPVEPTEEVGEEVEVVETIEAQPQPEAVAEVVEEAPAKPKLDIDF